MHRRLAVMCLLAGALAACSGDEPVATGGPAQPLYSVLDSSHRWISLESLPISVDPSQFGSPPGAFTSPGDDFDAYSLVYPPDDNDRSLFLSYAIFQPPRVTPEWNVAELRMGMFAPTPGNASGLQVLDSGEARIWGGDLQYELVSELVELGPTPTPINLDGVARTALRGPDRRQCLVFGWAPFDQSGLLAGQLCQRTELVARPVTREGILAIFEQLDFRLG